jgi:hypothetical protein
MGWPTGSHGKEYEVVELGLLNGFQPKDWEEKEISFSYFSDFISNEIYLNSNDL